MLSRVHVIDVLNNFESYTLILVKAFDSFVQEKRSNRQFGQFDPVPGFEDTSDCLWHIFSCQEYGHKAAFYHGSLDPGQRALVQKQWSKDEINIICATVAFGMGMSVYF